MILTTHALTGAVIGKTFENSGLIIIASFIVHFVMDSLRHGEYFDSRTATFKNTAWKIILDLAIAFSITSIYLYFKNPDTRALFNILLGMFTSMLPDGFVLLSWIFPKVKSFRTISNFHAHFHRYNRFPKYSPERLWTFRNATNDLTISIITTALLFLF